MRVDIHPAFNFLLFVTVRLNDNIGGLQCVPNKSFIYDHNSCTCSDNGQEIICKRQIYNTLYPELRSNQLQNLTLIVCHGEIPGNRILNVGCYECICQNNLNAVCIRIPRCNTEPIANRRQYCIPGSVFTDKCNGCICGQNGVASCTNLDCFALHGLKKPDDVMCVPNNNLVVECNQCSCSKTGMDVSCEKVGCDYPNFVHRHLLNVTTLCAPKHVFNYGPCHKCICSSTGNYAMCSGIQCNDQYEAEEEKSNVVKNTVNSCNPGIIFANDCNVCICSESGKGVCTTLSCDVHYSFKYVKQLSGAVAPGM